MSISNIVINDATSPTPVAHTFVPVANGNNARWVNGTGAATLKGQETLGLDVKRATDARSANTARLTMWDPVEVESANGSVIVSHGNSADLRFNFAQAATSEEREHLFTLAINAALAKKAEICGLLASF